MTDTGWHNKRNQKHKNADQRTNCSYIDDNNVYQDLTCPVNRFCCSGSPANRCSLKTCSSTTSTDDSNTISPTLFWSILGGLFGAGIIFILLMYVICKFRAPNSCLSEDHVHDAEMFEEECHEINTVSHQQSRHQPRFYIRRESFWRITRRKSTNGVCKQCEEKNKEKIEKNNDAPKEEAEMKNNITIIKNVAQQKNTKTKNILPLPDVG